MKKIVVSTFNNSKNNYGALFQSCALCSFLKDMGYEVSYVTVEDRGGKKSKKAQLKTLVKKILLSGSRSRLMKNRTAKLIKFAEETQNRICYKNKEMLMANPPKADVYISGSDQVWNPVNIHEDFFLTYVREGKKISYAASMGNENIPEHNKVRFGKYISEYDSISVREDTMIDIIKKYTDKDVVQNIDPVFLKTREEWLSLAKPYEALRFENFILVYAIEWNAQFNAELIKIKEQTGLPVVSVCIGNMNKIAAEQIIYDASPNEFLYLLDKAKYVIATSFHGTALSVLFNKPFLAFSGKDKPTRIESLMRHFELTGKNTASGETDYEKINEIIKNDREEAKSYLEKAIEG